MSIRLSRWALLTGLVFAVRTLKPTIAQAQADMPDAADLYPGRYAAVWANFRLRVRHRSLGRSIDVY
jgi:hypothetical protein